MEGGGGVTLRGWLVWFKYAYCFTCCNVVKWINSNTLQCKNDRWKKYVVAECTLDLVVLFWKACRDVHLHVCFQCEPCCVHVCIVNCSVIRQPHSTAHLHVYMLLAGKYKVSYMFIHSFVHHCDIHVQGSSRILDRYRKSSTCITGTFLGSPFIKLNIWVLYDDLSLDNLYIWVNKNSVFLPQLRVHVHCMCMYFGLHMSWPGAPNFRTTLITLLCGVAWIGNCQAVSVIYDMGMCYWYVDRYTHMYSRDRFIVLMTNSSPVLCP